MGVWGCAPSGVQGQSPWWGSLERSPQKLEAFCCVSSWFLYVQCTGSYCGNTASLLYVCNDNRNWMNCTYTVNHKKVAVHLCHNIGQELIIEMRNPNVTWRIIWHVYLFTTELRHTCCDTCTPKYLWSNAYISNGRRFTESAFVSCYYPLSVFLE